MKVNEGGLDRGVRVTLGVVFLIAAFLWLDVTAGSALGILAAAVGAVMVLTGLAGFCPAYALVGLRTCRLDK